MCQGEDTEIKECTEETSAIEGKGKPLANVGGPREQAHYTVSIWFLIWTVVHNLVYGIIHISL